MARCEEGVKDAVQNFQYLCVLFEDYSLRWRPSGVACMIVCACGCILRWYEEVPSTS